VSAQDFTTRLQLQLREAAEREERRSPAARRVAATRWALAPRMAGGPLIAAAAVGLVLLLGLWALTAHGPDPAPEPATPPGPRVVATVPIGEALNGGAVAAFGALWVSDSGRGEIVKVDPDSRRVTARIPVDGETNLAAGIGSLWAVRNASGTASGPLLRIDPRTGRIVKRIALRTPGGDPFFGAIPIAAGSRIWVGGPTGVLAVDPARDRVVGHIALAGGYNLQNALIHRGELWLTSASGSTDRYDARTGRRLGRVRWETGPTLIPYGDRFIHLGRDSVALVDADTGRAAWRTSVGQELHLGEVLGRRVLVAGLDGTNPREQLWQLDVRTGRLTRPITLPEFSPRRIVAAGGDTWVLAGGGRAVIVGG
jgi:hypothetical protein